MFNQPLYSGTPFDLKGHPDERPTPLERSYGNLNLNINVLNSTTDKRSPLLKVYISGANGWLTRGVSLYNDNE